MHIKSIHLPKFKRFTELSINGIPASAQLVVIAGPNGSGKSAIFEGVNVWRRYWGGYGITNDSGYYTKSGEADGPPLHAQVSVEFHEINPQNPDPLLRKAIWIRSAYRHEPSFSLSQLDKQGALLDQPGLARLIQEERTVASNYQRIVAASVAELFSGDSDDKSVAQLRQSFIGRIGNAMAAVFGDLELEGPGDPLAEGTFFFTKGASKHFRYENLSAGEKAAFDLLLDFVLRIQEFDDTVFCIDEPELHIGTKTQARLLHALVGLLPSKCQLWLATHSIGMMRAARDLALLKPEAVCFLDMSDHDFDTSVVLNPVPPDRRFWRRVLSVALDDLAELVAPERVVLCEGNVKDEWDARCYRQIFSDEFPDAEFLSVGNSYDVQTDSAHIGSAVTALAPGTVVSRVRDRDLMTDDEVDRAAAQGVRVLSRRHLESYLLADDVLTALCVARGAPEAATTLISARNSAVQRAVAERGKLPDDLKAVAGAVYNEAKQCLKLTGSGSNAREFMASVLAPLVPGTDSYVELRRDVFG